MRIATSTLYQNNIATLGKQESTLIDLQNQISSGKRLNTASDDPLAAAQTVQLTGANAQLTQYSANLNTANTTLQQEDNTFSSLSTLVQKAQTLVASATNATLDSTTRESLATQIDSVRTQLLALANTTDAQGAYVFGGTETAAQPFVDNGSTVTYQGSGTQRTVQVSDSRAIGVGEIGSSVFQGVQRSAAWVPSAAAGNTGSAVYGAVSVTDASAAAAAHGYTISFGSDASGATVYSVVDSTTQQTVVDKASYTANSAIGFGGLSVSLSGTPADGDSVSVAPASSAGTDLFGTLSDVSAALRSGSRSGGAALTNALTTAGVKLSNSLDNVLTVQASVGAREQEVTALQSVNSATALQYSTRLSDLTSTDIVSAYSQLTETQSSLEAAEKTFVQLQSLSLFDLIK